MHPNFPGMNPYLENPETWSEVHFWLIAELARMLNPVLAPKYRAAVEKRVYSDAILVGIPDVAVFQTRASKAQAIAVRGLQLNNAPLAKLFAEYRPLNPPILGDFRTFQSPPELGDLGG
jgi:Protein of unknown function (DUF4058)